MKSKMKVLVAVALAMIMSLSVAVMAAPGDDDTGELMNCPTCPPKSDGTYPQVTKEEGERRLKEKQDVDASLEH